MKVLIFGCQKIAVDFLNFLLGQKHIEIPLVITNENDLDKTYGYVSVAEWCIANNIRCINAKRISKSIEKKNS